MLTRDWSHELFFTFGVFWLSIPTRGDLGRADLAELWLADLALRDVAEGTKQTYRDQLRLHVRPALEHYTLAEITTGRAEWFLKSQSAFSY